MNTTSHEDQKKIILLESKVSALETKLLHYQTAFHMLQSEAGRALSLIREKDLKQAHQELSHAIWKANRELF